MAEPDPIARSPVPEADSPHARELALSDDSLTPKWRVFSDHSRPGTSRRASGRLEWSVSPGETTVLGERPQDDAVVDLTHVRAMFRLTGGDAARVLGKLCGLDLGNDMFPDGAAARTLVAEVATEIVRDDREGLPSYLILPSRSFALYLWDTILEAGSEYALARVTF